MKSIGEKKKEHYTFKKFLLHLKWDCQNCIFKISEKNRKCNTKKTFSNRKYYYYYLMKIMQLISTKQLQLISFIFFKLYICIRTTVHVPRSHFKMKKK